jgi:hypothetical protein
MPDKRKELQELYVAEQFGRVTAGTDLTTEMLQRSREQIAKSLDILRSTEVAKVWHPEPHTRFEHDQLALCTCISLPETIGCTYSISCCAFLNAPVGYFPKTSTS